MSLVNDFMNSYISEFSRFPGGSCFGPAKSGRIEFQSDAVIAMEETGNGNYDFVVLRFYLSENSEGALEASMSMIITDTVDDEREDHEFFLPISRESDLVALVRRCLIFSDVGEPLKGEALNLTHAVESMRRHFNDQIVFTDPVNPVVETIH